MHALIFTPHVLQTQEDDDGSDTSPSAEEDELGPEDADWDVFGEEDAVELAERRAELKLYSSGQQCVAG